MKIKDIMENIMEEKGVGKAQLGRAIGIDDSKHPSDVISKRLKQENISVKVLDEMLTVLGYTMVIVPAGSKIKDGEYEVTINE